MSGSHFYARKAAERWKCFCQQPLDVAVPLLTTGGSISQGPSCVNPWSTQQSLPPLGQSAVTRLSGPWAALVDAADLYAPIWSEVALLHGVTLQVKHSLLSY